MGVSQFVCVVASNLFPNINAIIIHMSNSLSSMCCSEIQCNLDLVTLLVFAKTVTKSNDFI